MYLNRQIRTRLDAMFPYYETKSEQKIKPHTRKLQVGERVRTKFFVSNKPIWKFGVISQKLGHLHYIVKLDEGREVKRHINQMQKSSIQKEKVTSNDSTSDSRSSQDENYIPDYYQVINPRVTQRDESTTDQDKGEHDQISSPPARRSVRPRHPPAYLQDYVRS